MKRNYQETLDWMFNQLPMYQRQGTSAFKKDLTNITALCDGLGNPENKLKFIHVAGTNGKGSVSHIIAGILQSQGYDVGMYTSPHYKDFRERIKINGNFISKRNVIDFINKHKTLIEEVTPSFFEITVAMALDYFAQQQPDYVVLEVGLGGRLDSTNIITPLLSVITNIGLDHQAMLGDTIEEIAVEKAGIIKPNIPVIIGERQEKIKKVFSNIANQKNAPLLYADEIVSISAIAESNTYKTVEILYDDDKLKIKTDLTAEYQLKNMRTAFAAVRTLETTHKIKIYSNKVIDFFPSLKSKTYYIGRWQILNNNPLIIADSAHNEDGIKHLIEQIRIIEYKRLHIIIGTVNDKDVKKMMNLFPIEAKYYFCKANIPRGLNAITLQEIALHNNRKGKVYSSVRKALSAAKLSAHNQDLIIISGSIFVVAEAI